MHLWVTLLWNRKMDNSDVDEGSIYENSFDEFNEELSTFIAAGPMQVPDLTSPFPDILSQDVAADYMSYQELTQSGAIITTTQRKKKIVDELHDYWQLKGLLLRIKRTPSLILKNENVETIVRFLDNHTEMPLHSFWNHLPHAKKLDVARRFSVIEGQGERHHMTFSGSKSEIFILLSGRVEFVQNNHENALSFSQGEVFGALSMFNESVAVEEDNQNSRPKMKSQTDSTRDLSNRNLPFATLNGVISKCTLLRLQFKEYALDVPPPKSFADEFDEEENFILNSPDFHPEDIICFRFMRKIKKTITKTFYDFLVDHDILPKHSRSPSYQYMTIGNRGRTLRLSRNDSRTVFVIVEGSMRLQITKPKANDTVETEKDSLNYEISCRRDGHNTKVKVKTPVLPLLILDSGNVFLINDSCFDLRSNDASAHETKPLYGRSSIHTLGVFTASVQSLELDTMSTSSLCSSPARRESSSMISISTQSIPSRKNSSTLSSVASATPSFQPNQINKNFKCNKLSESDDIYNIEIHFDKTTKYLAIPLELFKHGMKDLSMDITREVTRQLNQISSSIVSRIHMIMPIIQGSKDVVMKDIKQKPRIMPPVIENLLNHSNSNSVLVESQKTLGSFYRVKNAES